MLDSLSSLRLIGPSKGASPDGEIQQAIARELGVPTEVIIRTGSEMAAVVRENPLLEVSTNPSRLFVTFFAGGIDVGQMSDVDPTAYEPERSAFGDGVVYVWLPDGLQNSRLTQSFWERGFAGQRRLSARTA